ncbi:hypothetical protein LA66_00135 [Aureimonas altamirensis]|uniref:Uncharacterized protein n=1 Tax=Aureimonas altamirensis TaxID=370622 RepID=A0A0B1Q8L1_9HYPH|nr:hypothetical protein [Aureimonas altamirensis]KHJ55135.1 hypothetical protein LA66_00135 [Aureimonas altamirensis]
MDRHSNTMRAEAQATEDPHERARRLLLELSEALNEAFDGHYGAEVMPAYLRGKSWPIGFFNIQSHQLAWARAHRAQRYLRRVMTMSEEERAQHYRKRFQRAARAQEATI